ncbi:hypothetical protein KC799_01730 [candidate division KSB1 bacterium]|nr:hypothetical protein [candidate division KSB1 bacterium]
MNNAIIVGLLKGQDDFHEITVRLHQGEFKIRNEPNNLLPFEVFEYSTEWIGIRLKNPLFRDHNAVNVILYHFFDTDSELLRALLLGNVDYSVFHGRNLLDKYLSDMQGTQPIPILLPPNNVDMILYNLQHPILKSAAVRKAISFSIKKKEIEEKILENQGISASGSPYETDSGYFPKNEGIERYNYSPRRAIALLKQDGWQLNADEIYERNGQKLTFRLAFRKGIQLERRLATKIRNDLNLRGMEVILVPQNVAELKENLQAGNFDAVLWNHQFEETHFAFYDFFSNPETSFIKFSNTTFDLTYQHALSQPVSARKADIDRLQVIANQKCIATYLSFRWYLYHVFNINRLTNYYDGKLKPIDEWHIIKRN